MNIAFHLCVCVHGCGIVHYCRQDPMSAWEESLTVDGFRTFVILHAGHESLN